MQTTDLLITGSLIISALAVLSLGRHPLIRIGVLLYYAAWHLPFILNWLFPYESPLAEELHFSNVLLWLISLHIIILPALFVGILERPTPGRTVSSKDNAPISAFFMIAVIGALFVAIELFFVKGLSLSLSVNLSSNRDLASGPQTLFGQMGTVAAGFALYLILLAFYRTEDGLPKAQPMLLIPFTLMSCIVLLSGNRQFIAIGLLLMVLVLATVYRSGLSKMMLAILVIGVPLSAGLILFAMARQSSTKGRQDAFLLAISGIKIADQGNWFSSNYARRTSSLYVYYYYGTEPMVLSSAWNNDQSSAPPFSLTVPVLYRRFNGFLGLPTQDEVRAKELERLDSVYGIFPRIWATMYANVFYEWGRLGVFVFVLLLSLMHALLVRSFVLYRSAASSRRLCIFYAGIIFGIMFIPTYEVSFVGLLIAAGADAFVQSLDTAPSRVLSRSRSLVSQSDVV